MSLQLLFFLLIMQRHLSDSKVQLSSQVLGICRCCEEAFPTYWFTVNPGPHLLKPPLTSEPSNTASSSSCLILSLPLGHFFEILAFLVSMTLNHSCSNSLHTSTSSIVPCAVIVKIKFGCKQQTHHNSGLNKIEVHLSLM